MIRVDFIGDGIFAVAMMLLVLDLYVPVSEAIHSEQPLWVSGAMHMSTKRVHRIHHPRATRLCYCVKA